MRVLGPWGGRTVVVEVLVAVAASIKPVGEILAPFRLLRLLYFIEEEMLAARRSIILATLPANVRPSPLEVMRGRLQRDFVGGDAVGLVRGAGGRVERHRQRRRRPEQHAERREVGGRRAA